MLWLILLLSLISYGHCDDRSRADGAAATLMKYYNANVGLFQEHSGQKLWWTGANCLTAIIDYMMLTGSKQYMSVIETSFEKGIKYPGTKDFTNEFLDDSGWWGLAWVRAYDLTHDKKYLQMAEHISDYMWTYHDNICKGGIYWKNDKKYKSSISNELFIKLAASLHNRVGGDSKYLNEAKEVWNWFKASGVINGEHLVNDGIGIPSCKPEGATFTYNQGVILGGLVELFKATNDRGYLNDAESIANAATKSNNLNLNGVLKDGGDACNNDGASFKGAYIRGLAELSRALGNHPYHDYIEKNAESAYTHDRNNNNEYGLRWTGPFKVTTGKETGASCQHSALDLMNAALK